MIQKIMFALEINDTALDQAQAKADKLVETLREAEHLMTKLNNLGETRLRDNNNWLENLRPAEITCSPKMAFAD